MRHQTQVLAIALWLTTLAPTFAQGSFRNLDFESPIQPLVPDPFFHVPITNTLPGWTGYIGATVVDWTLYNNISLGDAAISLQSSPSWPPIQGNYSVLLQQSFPSLSVVPSIGQIGTVPGDAQSVRYLGKPFYNMSTAVSFGGQPLPVAILGGSADTFLIFGADISAFAGQTGELRFSGGGYFDGIQFSNQPIPEPSTFGLFALGALLLGWRLHKIRKP